MRLDGIRVLDLSQLLPGPYGTQLLADMGAEVIKVETPAGDGARYSPPETEAGMGSLFDAVNRGKRSIALDLKHDEGHEAFMRLAESADVVFEQFRPGVVDRLGIDYESVRERNGEIVYCSLTGFGQDGPHRNRVGHDLNYIGMAGMLDMTREGPDAAPQIPGYPVADMAGGLFAAFGIVGALCARELGNTGGEHVDVAMTDVVASFSQPVAYQALSGMGPRPGGTSLSGGFPWYDVYEAKDGEYVTIAALEPKFWETFCEAVGREDLIDSHMTDDEAELAALRAELEEIFAGKTREEWETQLGDVEAMVAPVWTPEEALTDERVEARDLIDRSTGVPRVGFPAKSSEPAEGAGEGAPGLGADTDALLAEVGYDEAALERLREDGVTS
jgi:crotonobetainyl-CoA:carnitine CoA-transferase CaiB-like acyl-CoA transferase